MSIKLSYLSSNELEVAVSKHNTNLDLFSSLLFMHAPEEDLELYTKAELKRAAQSVIDAVFLHKKDKPTILFSDNGVKKGEESLCVLTIINENKPFLFDSLLNLLTEHNIPIHFIAHPIFTVKDEGDTHHYSLVQECSLAHKIPEMILQGKQKGSDNSEDLIKTQKSAQRMSVIQFHIPNLEKTLRLGLEKEIRKVLDQVYEAVKDWPFMVKEVLNLANLYQDFGSKNTKKENTQTCQIMTQRVADFLNWLCADNFIFLGLRCYAYDQKKGFVLKENGCELGILKDKSLSLAPHFNICDAGTEFCSFIEQEKFLNVSKANIRSLVHRPVFLDYIGVSLFDEAGRLCGELSILGLFTSTAYTSSIFSIPYLKIKAETVMQCLGFCAEDYSGKAIINILENYPRDEIFHIDLESLVENIKILLELAERPKIRVLTHLDYYARFVSVLVYMPREHYSTDNYSKIGKYLLKIFEGDYYEGRPSFVSGALTRIYFVIHRKFDTELENVPPRAQIEKDIEDLTRGWQDAVRSAAGKQKIATKIIALAKDFPDYYRERFDAQAALEDAQHIQSLLDGRALIVHFYQQNRGGCERLGIKIFHANTPLALSERIPLLENMGFRAISERSYGLPDGQGGKVYFHDMRLEADNTQEINLTEIAKDLSCAFVAIWSGDADNDAFNGLIKTARMKWRQIVILRAYGRYLQQAGIAYTQNRLAEALNTHPKIAYALYRLFELKFDPAQSQYDNSENEQKIQEEIEVALRHVPNLDDDLILRRFRNLIAASLRSNAFLPQEDGQERRVLAIKLNPKQIDDLKEPRPYREIFVYSPEVEGVHLRFGPVARGGIRWSDRALDYRTEILGLVKAQQVKNAVIVPVGSKGGFYPHKLPQTEERAEIQEAARQAYIAYISALLSITDNIIDGQAVSAKNLICHDDKDPYFVVAADKGTATFSDTANAISQKNNFWLDDAFASGGSDGYDHKVMGITAKGAWEAVKRHFREVLERDIDKTPFTVVGIGDMSGDVFGNGVLLSKATRLIAAFDHRDIFIDPDPDPEISYLERQRLFSLPRSSWQDYDKTKISKGGGVFSRKQKMITLSKEAAQAIDFPKESGTPYEIMSAILQADVDLLWFGGIGTYVRASDETDAEVGDRANDIIRVTGKSVRAKIIGEGANLGFTQRGRIEYSLNGGRCDTDAIDNSGGVNCSDVEVNIKIALAAAMRQGQLTRENRNILLRSMADDVEKLVLRNNYLQPLALSLAEEESVKLLPYQARFMGSLERMNLLDRKVEILPSDAEIAERIAAGRGLTRPELSVLLAYAKLTLQEELTKSDLVEDPYFYNMLLQYFPKQMQKDYEEEISTHPLRRDIIATALANDVVNRGGALFVNQLQDKTGCTVEQILKAYTAVRDGFAILALYDDIDALDNRIPGKVQNTLYFAISKLLFEATSWALRNKNEENTIAEQVERIYNTCRVIAKSFRDMVPGHMIDQFEEKVQYYQNLGTDEDLAKRLAILSICSHIPHISGIVQKLKGDPSIIIKIYFALEQRLGINLMENSSQNIAIIDYYDSVALAKANDKIANALQSLVIHIFTHYGDKDDPIEAWIAQGGVLFENFLSRLYALLNNDLSISRFIVAASMLEDLAQEKLDK